MSKLHDVKEQVEHVLSRCSSARDDDKMLQVLVLREFYNIDISELLKPNVPSLESIRRCRQKLQAEGKYPSSRRTKQIRQEMEETYRQFAITKE
jgi:hypothetical protein